MFKVRLDESVTPARVMVCKSAALNVMVVNELSVNALRVRAAVALSATFKPVTVLDVPNATVFAFAPALDKYKVPAVLPALEAAPPRLT